MTGVRIGVGLCAVLLFTNLAPAQYLSRSIGSRMSPSAVAPATTAPSLIDFVEKKYRTDVSSVILKPTLTAKYAEETFTANPTVYKWLLEHPDRTALAWERVGVPCLPIKETSAGIYQFKDEGTANVSWQSVGTLADGMIWLATGSVKAGALLPTVPVKAVAVVRHTFETTLDGKRTITPTVQIYFQTESRAAVALMRIVGSAAPRMAEDGAEQLLFFFSGMARYLEKHPDQTAALLSPAKRTATK